MANPLRWFRRHAKILMVVLGSAAMAIFGLGPVFDAMSKPAVNNQREVEVIAKWNGGDITRSDLDALQIRHYQTQRFLRELDQEAVAKKGDQFQRLVAPIPPIREGERFQQSLVDEQLIDRFILAKKAEQEGIVVSDGVIDDYLALASGNAGFSQNDLIRINKAANQGGCSIENIRRHLRIELLAQQMRMYTLAGLPMIPNPLESMELHGRVTERVECQILPVSVEQYVNKIDEQPGDAELKKLYEQGKYDFPDPTGVKPGFKLRDKVMVQYLVAEFETFMQNEMNKLTDEDVQKKYEQLVAEKSDLVMEAIVDDQDDTIQIEDPPPVLPGDSKVDKDSDAAERPPAAGDSPNKAPESESQSNPDENGSGGDQSLNVVGNKSRYVSLRGQDESGDEAAEIDPVPVGDGKAEDSRQEGDAEVVEQQAVQEESELESEPMQENSSDDNGESADLGDDVEVDSAATSVDDGKSQLGPLMVPDEKQEIKKRVLPLKDVVDRVKRNMVAAKAQLAMEEAIKKANVVVSTHHTLRMKWEYTRESERGPAPEPLDFMAIADKYNLVAQETQMVDEVEFSNEPLGRIAVPVVVTLPNGQQQRQVRSVAEMLFNRFDDIKLYDPQTAVDFMTSNTYLYWLNEKEDAKTPEFEACRPAVEKFWKSQKAYEMALAEAQKIADETNRGDRTLAELYRDRVSETGEFTWFSSFGGAGLGNPVGVSQPGEEFMKTTFSLEKFRAAVAPNRTKDTVYVVQMLSDRTTVEEIGDDYLENYFFKFKRISPDVQNVARWYGQELNYEWNQELVDAMGLKFVGR